MYGPLKIGVIEGGAESEVRAPERWEQLFGAEEGCKGILGTFDG